MKDINEILEILEQPKGWLKISPNDIIHLKDYCLELKKQNEQLSIQRVSGSFNISDLHKLSEYFEDSVEIRAKIIDSFLNNT